MPDDPFYHTARWERRRRAYLRLHPFCVVCGARATVVDHVIPRGPGGGSDWNQDNWQPMCHADHNVKTAVERRGRWTIEKARAAAARRSPPYTTRARGAATDQAGHSIYLPQAPQPRSAVVRGDYSAREAPEPPSVPEQAPVAVTQRLRP